MLPIEFRSEGWLTHRTRACVLMGVVLMLQNARAEDLLQVNLGKVQIWSINEFKSSQVRQALDRRVTLEFQDDPLDECLKDLGSYCGIALSLDTHALEESNIKATAPVNASLRNVSLRQALKFILRPLELSWCVDENEILVTTPDAASDVGLQLRVYLLNNTIVWRTEETVDLESLIEVIQTSIYPDSWEELGGNGTIVDYGRTLVVRQSDEVHWQIERLLLSLNQAEPFGRPSQRSVIAPDMNAIHALLNSPSPEPQSKQQLSTAPTLPRAQRQYLPGVQLQRLFPGAQVHYGDPSRGNGGPKNGREAPVPPAGGGGGMFNVPDKGRAGS